MFLQDLMFNNHNTAIKNIYLGDQYMIGNKKVEFKNYQISGRTNENFVVLFTDPINEDGRKFLPKVSFSSIFLRSFEVDATKWLKFMYLSFSIVRKSDLKRFRVSANYWGQELRSFLANKSPIIKNTRLTISDKDIGIQDKSWLQSQYISMFYFDDYWLSPDNNEWMFDKLEMLIFVFEDNTPQPVLTQFKHWLDTAGFLRLTAPCVVTSNS